MYPLRNPLAASFFLLVACVPASALPVRYLFEGKVSGTSGPLPAGFDPGEPIWYLFSVDPDSPGIDVHHGQRYAMADRPDADFFFSEYLDGAAPEVEPIVEGDSFYFGSQAIGEGGSVRLNGSDDHAIGLQYDSKAWSRISIETEVPLSAWEPGLSGFRGENSFWRGQAGSDPVGVSIRSDLTLTAISYPYASVPEPSHWALFALGAGAALMAQSRSRRKRL